MENKRNYSIELDKIMKNPENRGKSLFLHSCCAPCSSYVLEYLRSFFRITVFYYNPNITADEEYAKRVIEQKRLISELNAQTDTDMQGKEDGDAPAFKIEIVEGDYDKQLFFDRVKGLEKCKEGGERCFACYELRLAETAKQARVREMDYFTTTLTISPLKNAVKLNEIGERLASEHDVAWLPSDFKKKGGYQRSIELSKEHDLYRQNYCGCIYSKMEREIKEKNDKSSNI